MGFFSSLKDKKMRGCFIFTAKLHLIDCIGKEMKEQNAKEVSSTLKVFSSWWIKQRGKQRLKRGFSFSIQHGSERLCNQTVLRNIGRTVICHPEFCDHVSGSTSWDSLIQCWWEAPSTQTSRLFSGINMWEFCKTSHVMVGICNFWVTI